MNMCELEALMGQLLELARNNPGLLFKITPNESYEGWGVEFTKGNHWWRIVADYPGEPTIEIIKEALSYFDSLTDEVMASKLAKVK